MVPGEKLFIHKDEGEWEFLIRFYKENDNIFIFGAQFMDFFTNVCDYEEKEVGFYGGKSIEIT